jgi:hypothetical protein
MSVADITQLANNLANRIPTSAGGSTAAPTAAGSNPRPSNGSFHSSQGFFAAASPSGAAVSMTASFNPTATVADWQIQSDSHTPDKPAVRQFSIAEVSSAADTNHVHWFGARGRSADDAPSADSLGDALLENSAAAHRPSGYTVSP